MASPTRANAMRMLAEIKQYVEVLAFLGNKAKSTAPARGQHVFECQKEIKKHTFFETLSASMQNSYHIQLILSEIMAVKKHSRRLSTHLPHKTSLPLSRCDCT